MRPKEIDDFDRYVRKLVIKRLIGEITGIGLVGDRRWMMKKKN